MLAQVDRERFGVVPGIVDGELDIERPVVRPAVDLFSHLGHVAHRAAAGIDPQVVAEALRPDHERVSLPGCQPSNRSRSAPGLPGKGRPSVKTCRYIAFTS